MRPRRRPYRRDSACLNASSNPTNRPRRRSRSRSLNTAGHRRAPETENDHDDEGRLRNPLTPTHECLALH